jgi:outer membrane protein TolC
MPEMWHTQDSMFRQETGLESQLVWWKNFNDPILDQLIEECLRDNLSLQSAGLRIIQARSAKNRAVQMLSPLPLLSAEAYRTQPSKNVTPDVDVDEGSFVFEPGNLYTYLPPDAVLPSLTIEPGGIKVSDHVDVFGVGANVLWEPDLWGKVRRAIEGKTARLEATEAFYDDMVVLLCSEVAETYIEIRTAQARLRMLDKNEETLVQLIDQIKNNKKAESLLAEVLLLGLRAQRPSLKAAHVQIENSLCILLGDPPSSLDEKLGEDNIPKVHLEVFTGLPMDLLRRRPDIREAERIAAAECSDIGHNKAKIFPSFSLLGALGFSSSKTNTIFDDDSFSYLYGLGINWDILLYSFIQERVRLEDAQYQEAVVRYQETVLEALREVEDSMVGVLAAREETNILIETAERADEAFRSALDDGVSFDTLLEAARYSINLSDQCIISQGRSTLASVRLYKALGGGWTEQLGAPIIPEEIIERMKEDTDWKTFGGLTRLTAPR